ncbi:hypothetical protein FocTR4_00004741 [Fusarium oxysporum f. sp. cubense]|uniref:Oxidoreductase acuF-like C2H2 type zinc-finger domain-containing protein n=1 Tax=Fusarium oxysporum f. sp. cubense TaxID=61366 RepID=A0A5C6TGD3_FUSOC|nr:hypothetical protein FocTR4_00004741 [Fusarium oxysporum f. sp. cubense]
MSNSIDQLAKDCTRGFEVLNLQLKNPAVANIVKSDELARLKNGQSRFTRWKRNAGAHTLDQKLQNNTRVKIQAIRLLSHIQRLLEDAHAITVGDQVPWDQINDEEDSQSEDERESLDSSPETEMEQVLAHIANAIGNLSYLGAALREPLADGRITDETSPYEPFDVQHVRSKYPGVDEVIAERLGKDISARRKLFQGQDSTELSSYPSRGPPADEPTLETLFNELDLEDLNYQGSEQEEIYDENSSQTSYIASEDLRAHQIPPLPQKAADGGPFRCPFCNKMMRGLSTKTWKEHCQTHGGEKEPSEIEDLVQFSTVNKTEIPEKTACPLSSEAACTLCYSPGLTMTEETLLQPSRETGMDGLDPTTQEVGTLNNEDLASLNEDQKESVASSTSGPDEQSGTSIRTSDYFSIGKRARSGGHTQSEWESFAGSSSNPGRQRGGFWNVR